MRTEIVHASNGNCHKYGSAVLHRAVRFAVQNELDSDPEILWHSMAQQMYANPPSMLMLAAIDGNKVRGHLLARLQEYDGSRSVFISHLQIDKNARENREGVIASGLEMIVNWAKSNGATSIRCWAMNEKVAGIFSALGFEPKDYVLMESPIKETSED
jgi:hypothetical protein